MDKMALRVKTESVYNLGIIQSGIDKKMIQLTVNHLLRTILANFNYLYKAELEDYPEEIPTVIKFRYPIREGPYGFRHRLVECDNVIEQRNILRTTEDLPPNFFTNTEQVILSALADNQVFVKNRKMNTSNLALLDGLVQGIPFRFLKGFWQINDYHLPIFQNIDIFENSFILIRINPLIINAETLESYYPIVIKIDFENAISSNRKKGLLRYGYEQFYEEIIKMVNIVFPAPIIDNSFSLPSNYNQIVPIIGTFYNRGYLPKEKIIKKPVDFRTTLEQEYVESFLIENLQVKEDTIISESGEDIAIDSISSNIENNVIKARITKIKRNLKNSNIRLLDEELALYVRKTFGAEGLRHLLAFIISMDEMGRKGVFDWSVNEHLTRLGYKKKKSGSFSKREKEVAFAIMNILTDVHLSVVFERGKRAVLKTFPLFQFRGTETDLDTDHLNTKYKIAATNWYTDAFPSKSRNRKPTYTKMLKKIVTENHKNHYITIFLTTLLSISWRINSNFTMKVKTLLEWCDIDYDGKHGLREILKLEDELDYMKGQGYIGLWICRGERSRPSLCKKPLECVILKIFWFSTPNH